MEATDSHMRAPDPSRHAIVVANGDADPARLHELVDGGRRPLVIAADGGARAVRAAGLVPDLVVGDGDSLSAADRSRLAADGVEVRLASAAKDESDTELCLLAAVAAGATRITIHGAFGGARPEHTVANLLLLADSRLDGREVELHVGTSWMTRIGAQDREGHLELSGMPGDYVSLFALGSGIAGFAGALYAHYFRFVTSEQFEILMSATILTMVVVGGLRTPWGPVVGAILLQILPQAITFLNLPPVLLGPLQGLLFTGLVLIFMFLRPGGLAG